MGGAVHCRCAHMHARSTRPRVVKYTWLAAVRWSRQTCGPTRPGIYHMRVPSLSYLWRVDLVQNPNHYLSDRLARTALGVHEEIISAGRRARQTGRKMHQVLPPGQVFIAARLTGLEISDEFESTTCVAKSTNQGTF